MWYKLYFEIEKSPIIPEFSQFSKMLILVNKSNFGQKNQILAKNSNFGQKFKFWSKIRFCSKNSNVGQKFKFWSKNQIWSTKKSTFGQQKNQILVKN